MKIENKFIHFMYFILHKHEINKKQGLFSKYQKQKLEI